MITALVIVGVLIVLAMFVVGIYNKLVTLKNRFENAFSQIEVQLQRRYDLIPNLIETVKGYMKHEKETLKMVIDARNSANEAAKAASGNPSDQNAMKDLQASEQKLQGAMMSFQALAEGYPDLKANTNMLALQEELATTENKVAFSRQAFNDSVTAYNTYKQTFPPVFFAGMFGHGQDGTLLEFESKKIKEAPKVQF